MLVSKDIESKVKAFCDNHDTRSEIYDRKVEDHLANIRSGDTNLHPVFQRRYVWNQVTASRLIESIFLRYVIPPIHLSETLVGDSKTVAIVIDGQQRLTTLLNFVDNVNYWKPGADFKLSGLEILTDLNGHTFKELPASFKQTILAYKLRAIIGSGTDKEAVSELFIRLNQNTWTMNAAEIRNAHHCSDFSKFLDKLAENETFIRLTHKHNNNRFAGSELVCRFMAFYRQGFAKYTGRMEPFIQSEMGYWKAHYDSQVLAHYEARFKLALQMAETVFGPNVFHRGGSTSGRISNVMFELVTSGLAARSYDEVLAKKDELAAACQMALLNPEFIDSISKSTNENARVQTRFRIWTAALDSVLGEPGELAPRATLSIPVVPESIEDMWMAEQVSPEAKAISYVRDMIRGADSTAKDWICDDCGSPILTEQADSVEVFGLVLSSDKAWDFEIRHNPADCVRVLEEVA